MMPDAAPEPLDYQRLRRRRTPRLIERIVDAFAISLALLWPIWAFFVTRYCTAHSGAMTATGTLLIVATVSLPIGFGVLVAGFVPDVRSGRKT